MENLKSAVGFVAKGINVTDAALADGWQMTDAIAILGHLMGTQSFVEAVKGAKADWEARTDAQVEELKAHFKAQFDIRNDAAEVKIEKYFNVAVSIIDAVA